MNSLNWLRCGGVARQTVMSSLLLLAVGVTFAQADRVASEGVPPLDAQRVTVSGDTLWDLSATLATRYPGSSRFQVMAALLRANPQAFVQGNVHRLRVGVPLVLPSAAQVQGESLAAAQALVERSAGDAVLNEGAGSEPALTAPEPVASEAQAEAVAAPASPSIDATVASAPIAVEPTAPQPQGSAARSLWWGVGVLAVLLGGVLVWWMQRVPALPEDQKVPWSVSRARFEEGVTRATRVSQAAADLARQVELAPAAHRLVAVTPAHTEPGDALALLEQAGQISESDARLQLLIVRTWLEMGRVVQARQLLSVMAATLPPPPWADEVQALSARAELA